MNMEIIQQSIDKMQELDKKLVKNIIRRKNFSDATKEYSEEIIRITCNRIGKYLEAIDEAIYNSEGRSNQYNSDKKNISRTITIPLGEIKFKRRRYQDKETKEYVFLLDRYLGIDLNEKSTDAVKARILDESIDTTYKKGGEKAAYNISYTKQTTKNIIDSLTPELIVAKNEDEKKEIEYLYIDADEAHVKIQKNNKVKQVLCKEIYVYEGKELEAPKSKRKRLINKWTFSGVYEKSVENSRLWEEVRIYILDHYKVPKIKKIFLNADGGAWIREGMNMFPNMECVFDEFHLKEYINRMTSHLKDSVDDAKEELYNILAHKEMDKLDIYIDNLYNVANNKRTINVISQCESFIKNNIDAIYRRLNHNGDPILGCSAEAHISHDLASRMTTICRGWSVENADRMARLRAYKINGGNIYELIKANHEWLKGNRDNIIKFTPNNDKLKYICTKDKVSTTVIGKYYDAMQATIDNEIRYKYKLNF